MIAQFAFWSLLLAACLATCLRAHESLGSKETLNTISKEQSYSIGTSGSLEDPLLELVKRFGGEAASKKHVSSLLASDDLYDSHTRLLSTDLLTNSGFKYELHNCTSSDGYVTQLVRIVNPKVARSVLRTPAVVLYAGQGYSTAVFLAAAIGGGHPIPWPREKQWLATGPSGNRSLALTLSNNGYDVWLVPARGVDAANRNRSPTSRLKQESAPIPDGGAEFPFSHEGLLKMLKDWQSQLYWSFSNDELIEHEFGSQLRLVLKLAGCQKLSLINYSNGAFVSFAFMAHEPEFAHRHLDLVISIAPAVFVDVKSNLALGANGLLSTLTPLSEPYPDGTIDFIARHAFEQLCKRKSIRYSLCKVLLDQLYGHSDLFNSHLELSFLDFIGRPLSARGLRQSLQVGLSGQLRHYDHGPVCNLLEYNQLRPPAYELSRVLHERLFIVSGANDAIVSESSVSKLLAELNSCKPQKSLNILGYNHLDLMLAYDNTEKVNMPILAILDDRNIEENYYREEAPKKQASASASISEPTTPLGSNSNNTISKSNPATYKASPSTSGATLASSPIAIKPSGSLGVRPKTDRPSIRRPQNQIRARPPRLRVPQSGPKGGAGRRIQRPKVQIGARPEQIPKANV